jgi:hypothetical protein
MNPLYDQGFSAGIAFARIFKPVGSLNSQIPPPRSSAMSRITLGIVLGIVAGLADLSLMAITHFPGGRDVKLGAFSDRFLIGFFIATTTIPMNPVFSGLLIGALVSVPPAIILREYAKIMVSGIVLGGLLGYAIRVFG